MKASMRVAAAVSAVVLAAVALGCASTEPGRTFASRLGAGDASEAVAAPAGETASTDASTAPLLSAHPRATDGAALGFDELAAIRYAAAIASLGPRVGGSRAESRAADYIAAQLRDYGYEVTFDTFKLPSGKTSRNVIAVAPGADSSRRVIIGGHMDSKSGSPGANDNASGCGVLLELARISASTTPPVSVEYIWWGTEEYVDIKRDAHHVGSRHHAKSLSKAQRKAIAGVMVIDMIGVGKTFHVRTMNRGPQTLRRQLIADAKRQGLKMTFLKDLGRTGWSDHEMYERLGMPVGWIEWQSDPNYHTKRDTADKLDSKRVKTTGRFVLGWLYSLDAARIQALDKR
jgi:Zn-dependent M28 family amino/carboxypeptidase